MVYNKQALAKLWEIIHDKRNIFAGKYIGLIEVEFNLSISEFEKRNREEHKKVVNNIETIVSTDLNEVVEILSSVFVKIKYHHLSCAADMGLNHNAALCIHYLNPKDKRLYAIAIPGVNYIPDQETSSMLKERLKI